MTTKKQKSQKKKTRETDCSFSCRDFERMGDMINKFCEEPGKMSLCCSMTEKIVKEDTKTSGE